MSTAYRIGDDVYTLDEMRDEHGIDSIAIGTRPENRDGAVECYDEEGQPADCK